MVAFLRGTQDVPWDIQKCFRIFWNSLPCGGPPKREINAAFLCGTQDVPWGIQKKLSHFPRLRVIRGIPRQEAAAVFLTNQAASPAAANRAGARGRLPSKRAARAAQIQ